jgi:hypothetical protein
LVYFSSSHKCFDISEGSNIIKLFIFVESTFSRKPLAFELTNEVMNIGRNGREAVQLVDTNSILVPNLPNYFTKESSRF